MKLYAVKTEVSHFTNVTKTNRASNSAKCEVPLLKDGTSLHRVGGREYKAGEQSGQ